MMLWVPQSQLPVHLTAGLNAYQVVSNQGAAPQPDLVMKVVNNRMDQKTGIDLSTMIYFDYKSDAKERRIIFHSS